ncbi:MAG: NHL repeat-containing protein [Melioribacteraceae bacterium]|nr:NHL repeat-containing protein [Melioribacteraceae bacterium]MCF8264346.1 NHL repeat-containing protein [Melioribacteraceae bacterium]MCF8431578.1 NHL repeat-containing protein [Melioribacteraceae bacterium]
MKLLLIIVFITNSFLSAQLIEEYEFGNFNSANSFSIAPTGFVYISDDQSNEVYKYSLQGKKLGSVGGYGWEIESFDLPVDVFANTLNIYIADFNNNRIQFFDKDLNFISVLPSRSNNSNSVEFYYPKAVQVSNLGDFFILESDNNSILKFDLNGRFKLTIGGYDAGKFGLNSPADFAIINDLLLGIIDGKRFVLLDQFGNGLQILELDFQPISVSAHENLFIANSNNTVMEIEIKNNLIAGTKYLIDGNNKFRIVEARKHKEQLLLLLKNEIIVFKYPKKSK